MIKHIACIALALAVVGCKPAATSEPAAQIPAAEQPDPTSPGMELPVASELLAEAPLAGRWEQVGDGATTGVLFTPTDYPQTLGIGCDGGSGDVYINWTISDPSEDAEVRVYTLAKTEVFQATGFNDGTHMRAISVAGTDPRLAVLKTPQTSFAVQSTGEAIVVPWDASVAAALNDCAG